MSENWCLLLIYRIIIKAHCSIGVWPICLNLNIPKIQNKIFSDTQFLYFFFSWSLWPLVFDHLYKILVKSETGNLWSLTSCLPKDIEKNTIFVASGIYFLDTRGCEILGTYINLSVFPFISAFSTHLSFDLISVKHRSCQFQSGHLTQDCTFDSVGYQILHRERSTRQIQSAEVLLSPMCSPLDH